MLIVALAVGGRFPASAERLHSGAALAATRTTEAEDECRHLFGAATALHQSSLCEWSTIADADDHQRERE